MNMKKADYKRLSNEKTPNSPIIMDVLLAFIIGGAICVFGQVIMNIYKSSGLSKEEASSATSITLVFLGAFFTGLGWYDKLAKHAGAGTVVPITGFANSIVSPAMEFKSEGLVLGIGAKMFAIAGPVLVYGITTAVIYGIFVYIFGLIPM